MKKVRNILAVGVVALMTSCSVSGPICVTDNTCLEKRGQASYSIWLGFIRPMNADVSIKKACENGGITKVGTVDAKVYGGLIRSTYTVTVTGS